jgi:hypothetical protein
MSVEKHVPVFFESRRDDMSVYGYIVNGYHNDVDTRCFFYRHVIPTGFFVVVVCLFYQHFISTGLM